VDMTGECCRTDIRMNEVRRFAKMTRRSLLLAGHREWTRTRSYLSVRRSWGRDEKSNDMQTKRVGQ